MVVGDGVPQDPVEPGDSRCRAIGWGVSECSDKRFLKDVLRLGTGPHPLLDECKKPGMTLHEHPQHLWCLRVSLDLFEWSAIYSHPHPQSQPPSWQGHSGPQVQPQPQSGVTSVELLMDLSFGYVRKPSSVPSHLQTHTGPKYYTPKVLRYSGLIRTPAQRACAPGAGRDPLVPRPGYTRGS